MSELEMTTEAEVEDFTDELSDEALDRAEGPLRTAAVFLLPVANSASNVRWTLPVANR